MNEFPQSSPGTPSLGSLPAGHPLAYDSPAPAARKRVPALSAGTTPRDTLAPLVAWLYGRVSDARKGKSKSVQQQNDLGRGACQEYGWILEREYNVSTDPRNQDRAASRQAKARRVHWDKLIADIQNGERPDILILWEVSRGDRVSWRGAYFLEMCRDYGIRIYITGTSTLYDVSKPSDWDTLARAFVAAQYETEQLAQRVNRGVSPALADGDPYGKIPYGWRRRYDPDTRELIEQYRCPDTAPIVEEITRRVAKNHPLCTIRDDFNARGVTTPGDVTRMRNNGGRPLAKRARWDITMIRRLATTWTNIGMRVDSQGNLVQGKWCAIVEPEDFYAARKVITAPERMEHAKWARPVRARHLVSGVALCGQCGVGMVGLPPRDAVPAQNGRKARRAEPHRYRCSTGSIKNGPSCHRAIRAAPLEEYVIATLVMLLSNGSIYGAMGNGDDREVVQARIERDRAQGELAELHALVEADGPDAPSLTLATAKERAIRKRIVTAESRISAALVPEELKELWSLEGRVLDLAEWFTSDATPLGAKKSAIKRLVSIKVHGGKPGRGEDAVDSRVDITPLCPQGCGTELTNVGDRWHCGSCTPLTAVA